MNGIKQKLISHEKTIGTVSSAFSIIMFFSLIEIFISNINGNSNIFVQPFATALNGVFWSLYAYAKDDKYLLIPNILAFLIGISTVVAAFM